MSAAALSDRLGRPLHDLRVSVLDACNFRCSYCMPAHRDYTFLKSEELLGFAEIERLARLFVALGTRKLRLTGGEPLLRRGLCELVERLAPIEGAADLCLTTNGLLLAPLARSLKEAGLQRITVSLDSLDESRFRELSGGRGELGRVLEGIEAAADAGLAVKLNAVIRRGRNDRDVPALAAYARASGRSVRFIEYMDVGTLNDWRPEDVVASGEILAILRERYQLVPLAADYYGEVAQRFAFADGAGEIGFISSVSQPFCGSCTRARLAADGRFYTCLFAATGLDLKGPLRAGCGDEELLELIRARWTRREDRYSELREERVKAPQRVEMFRIGG